MTNAGTLEATGGGTLVLEDATVDNVAAGAITVGSNSVLDLSGSTISGGGITDENIVDVTASGTINGGAALTGGGAITVTSGQTLTLNDVTATNIAVADSGSLVVNSDQMLTLAGADTITGTPIVLGSYNAVNDFSIVNGNPNEVWSYLVVGTPLNVVGTENDFIYWTTGQSLPEDASIGTATVFPYSGNIELPSPYLNLDPQILADVAVGFTAPAAGTYNIVGSFRGDNPGEHSHPVEILVDGNVVFSDTISSYDQPTQFDLTETLNAGDTIDFVVDTGPNGDLYSLGTGLSANITELSVGGSELNNAGTINITGTTSLTSVSLNNDGGVLQVDGTLNLDLVALSGGTVNVTGVLDATGTSTISGATVTIAGTGNLEITSGTLTLDPSGFTNAGLLKAVSGGTIDLETSVDNTGSNPLAETGASGILIGANSTLEIDGNNPSWDGDQLIANTLSLTGGGEVTLTGGTITENADNNLVTSSGAILVLDNVNNTISGAGTIGNGDDHLALTNETHGVIDATGGTLTLDTGANVITNAGLLEATGGGTLAIEGDTVTNTGGTIEAIGASAIVDFWTPRLRAARCSPAGPAAAAAISTSLWRPART